MLRQLKRIQLFSIIILITTHSALIGSDTLTFNERDSIQDIQLEELQRQTKALNLLIRRSVEEFRVITDSLDYLNKQQEHKIIQLEQEKNILTEGYTDLLVKSNENLTLISDSRMVFRRYFFIAVPILLLVIGSVFIILFLMINRTRKTADARLNALRKYTYAGIEEVRANYTNEIKRRVNKIAAKFKGNGGKGKSKKAKVKRQK